MIGVYEAAPLCGASEAPECIRVLRNQLHPHITSGDINSLCRYMYRLHQPVKNPISDNSNILWNSPSLEINSRYRLP